MTCNGCRGGVEKALAACPGVTSATVNLESGLAEVVGSASPDELIAAVAAKGKGAELVAPSGTRQMGITRMALLTALGLGSVFLLRSSEAEREHVVVGGTRLARRVSGMLVTEQQQQLVASRIVPMVSRLYQSTVGLLTRHLPALLKVPAPPSGS